MDALAKGAVSAIIAYTAHYGTAKLYGQFCVPDGFWGFLQGFVTTGSPVCKAGLEVMTSTQISYSTVAFLGITRFIVDLMAPVPGA